MRVAFNSERDSDDEYSSAGTRTPSTPFPLPRSSSSSSSGGVYTPMYALDQETPIADSNATNTTISIDSTPVPLPRLDQETPNPNPMPHLHSDSTSSSTQSTPVVNPVPHTNTASARKVNNSNPSTHSNPNPPVNHSNSTSPQKPRDKDHAIKVEINHDGTQSFPYLIVNIGSGVSILKVSSATEFERVSGSSVGGGTFWGLCRLFTTATTYEDALAMSEVGDAKQLDMLVKDIYGGGCKYSRLNEWGIYESR